MLKPLMVSLLLLFPASVEASAECPLPAGAPSWYTLARQHVDDPSLIASARTLTKSCCAANKCCPELFRVESALRARLIGYMAKEKKLQQQTLEDLSEADAARKITELAETKKKIDFILEVLPRRPNPSDAESFYDFERRFMQFYAGAESAPDNLSEVSPVIGFLVQTRFRERFPDCREGLALHGIHNGFRTQIGSRRESHFVDKDGNLLKNAFEFGLEVFLPMWRTEPLTKADEKYPSANLSGAIVEVGGRWNSARKEAVVDPRYYGGLRLAFSPENITDFLIGKTESREGWRIEARAQGRVGSLKEKPLLLGASGNIGLGQRDGDTVRVYLLWRTDFSSSLGALVPK